jgi:tetratricopeptide (TPR) repeat protein
MMHNESAIDRAVELHGDALRALEDVQLQRALDLAGEALEIFERESGPLHPDVANVLNCLARIHEQLADYPAAESASRRAVAIMRDVRMQVSDPDVERLYVHSLIGLGNMTRVLGRYDEAEPILRDAIERAESALGPDDDDLSSALNSLGMLFKYTGRFDEAASL